MCIGGWNLVEARRSIQMGYNEHCRICASWRDWRANSRVDLPKWVQMFKLQRSHVFDTFLQMKTKQKQDRASNLGKFLWSDVKFRQNLSTFRKMRVYLCKYTTTAFKKTPTYLQLVVSIHLLSWFRWTSKQQNAYTSRISAQIKRYCPLRYVNYIGVARRRCKSWSSAGNVHCRWWCRGCDTFAEKLCGRTLTNDHSSTLGIIECR